MGEAPTTTEEILYDSVEMEGGEEESEFEEKGWSFDSFAPADSFDNEDEDDSEDDDSIEIDVDTNRKIASGKKAKKHDMKKTPKTKKPKKAKKTKKKPKKDDSDDEDEASKKPSKADKPKKDKKPKGEKPKKTKKPKKPKMKKSKSGKKMRMSMLGFPHRRIENNAGVVIDVTGARSDGRCGRKFNFAPCALVPVNGNEFATPCCNNGRCVSQANCECSTCVNYAHVNNFMKDVKTSQRSASGTTPSAADLIDSNRDAYAAWAVENLSGSGHLSKILRVISTQHKNLKLLLQREGAKNCVNTKKNPAEPTGQVVRAKVRKMTDELNFPGVIEFLADLYLDQNISDVCKEQIDTEKLLKRVNRPTEAIKKVIEKLERASDREKPTNVFMKELNIPAHLSDEKKKPLFSKLFLKKKKKKKKKK